MLGNSQCPDWVDYPFNAVGATSGMIGKSAVICGGSLTDECYKISAKKADFFVKMTTKRYLAASAKINDTTFWITGGLASLDYNSGSQSQSYILTSTEFVQMKRTMPGPELPMHLHNHVMVYVRNDLTMVIGGFGGYSLGNTYSAEPLAKTFYYNHNCGNWSEGPGLIQARFRHAAGIVTDESTQEKLVIVTAGGNYVKNFLRSTEILLDDTWSVGKSLRHRGACNEVHKMGVCNKI